MAGSSNWTQVTEFVLLGFSGITHGQTYLFLVFLVIYLVNLLGNLTIVGLILLDPHLHSPMYFFLSHLYCMDVCYSSVTVPSILANLLLRRHNISYHLCLAQMFFLMAFSGSECWLLAAMAYNLYAAICQPLHFSYLMSTGVCVQQATIVWVVVFLDSVVHIALASNLHFCGSLQIHHIFCNLPPLLKIACWNKRISKITVHITTIFMGLGPFLVVVISYVYILASISRICCNTGQRETFSHMIVVVLYFGSGLVNYNHPRARYSLEVDILFILKS